MAKFLVVDMHTELGFVTVDAGGVASLLGIKRDKVHDIFRNDIKFFQNEQFIIIKSPYFISSRRGGNMMVKRKK